MASDLSSLLTEGLILDTQNIDSRKRVLQTLASAIAEKIGADARDVLDAVLERENLGSTGVGDGVAIPHARLNGISVPIGAFLRLEQGVEFEAIDERPCDLIFMLLAPHNSGADHLRALAQVSRTFRNAELRDALRATATRKEIAEILCPRNVAADAA